MEAVSFVEELGETDMERSLNEKLMVHFILSGMFVVNRHQPAPPRDKGQPRARHAIAF
ncbi:MAG: hypothetical protein NT172_09870 [Planctomycetota bacterium]|nr:hypothetical protein [Planctomycetota bacterium]